MVHFPMMGRNDKPQKPLFYSFNLNEVVPQDHLLCKIDRFLDLSDLRAHLAHYYSHDRSSPWCNMQANRRLA